MILLGKFLIESIHRQADLCLLEGYLLPYLKFLKTQGECGLHCIQDDNVVYLYRRGDSLYRLTKTVNNFVTYFATFERRNICSTPLK